jgi:hypothetical protein
VVLVPLGSGLSIDKEKIQNELNTIYRQAVASWEVEIAPDLTLSASWDLNSDGKIAVNSDILSRYSEEMEKINTQLKSQSYYSKNTFYLFLSKVDPEGDLKGEMPRSRNIGYIFLSNQSSALANTIAHELGHGAFNLGHVFDEYNSKPGATDNLMDYNNGTTLCKAQWDHIHKPSAIIGVLEGDDKGMLKTEYTALEDVTGKGEVIDSKVYMGIAPDGRIIESVSAPGKGIVSIVKNDMPYVISGIQLYEKGVLVKGYKWFPSTAQQESGYYNNGTALNVGFLAGSGTHQVNIYKIQDNCHFREKIIEWENKETPNIIATIDQKTGSDQWKSHLLYAADASCYRMFVEEIVKHDRSVDCTTLSDEEISKQKATIIAQLNAKTVDMVAFTNLLNATCKTVLLNLSYQQLETVFRLLAKSEKIKNDREVAILRIMSCIKIPDYTRFNTLLEENNGSILTHLLAEMDDSFYPWGNDDHHTNFIGGLVMMAKEDLSTIDKKFVDMPDEQAVSRIFNLNEEYFDNDIKVTGFEVSLNTFRYRGYYSEATGKVAIYREEKIAIVNPLDDDPFKQATTSWVAAGKPLEVSPLSPILISASEQLPLVTTALGEPIVAGEKYFYVPAIFLHFQKNKEIEDALVKQAMLALDAVTIASSGGTALALKIGRIRRIWALCELAGAVGNISINTELIKPGDKLYEAVNIYNTGMAIIGLGNIGSGIINFAKQLPQQTLDLVKSNGNIRAIILAKYLDYQAAIKNLDNLSDAEKQLLARQEKVWKVLVGEVGGTVGNNLFKVDNTLKSADELAGVLINGEYRLNPTAKNVSQLIKNPSGAMKLDQSAGSILNGQYMYVVDEADNIIIGTRAKGFDFSVPDGKAPHPTLIGGVDPTVKTAGIIEFRAGKIYKVDNVSGHFKPSTQSLQNAQPLFNQKFAPNNYADDFQGFIPFSN